MMETNGYKTASILLVDDDDIDAMAIERALRKMKVANPLFRARDGVEGLRLLREKAVNQPYIILLDLNMPRMGGIEMLQELRKDPLISDSVVFVLTTSKDDEDMLAAYRQHIAGYIVKKSLDSGFDELIKLLDHYWRLVELPVKS